MDHLTRELEETLLAYQAGTEQPPPGMDSRECFAEIQEELEDALREDARKFLEATKNLSKDEQIASWRNWLYNENGEVHQWRSNVYCELDTPTMPSVK